ncbi:LANO_0G16622g1_1 [Lachancea nothofagi CBS 11611]|uniref:LANO_0G16622g1_1 n=1 Tax=Lachancea nothofagi CBS 11611 TaxID=1266666 RepID=A0A1G4KKJ6_9SACH|nr:LANO_0G16622g1_1 [Lachancea nothofagi CBS 11611]
MNDEFSKYIHSRLIEDVQIVLFTDLMANFSICSGKAKKAMYDFYKTTTSKVNCVIVCGYKNGLIQIIDNLKDFKDDDELLDVFIYAFNPMNQFVPVNAMVKRPVAISNCYEVAHEILPAAPVVPTKLDVEETEPSTDVRPEQKSLPAGTKRVATRAQTLPAKPRGSKPQPKAPVKSAGELRSTVLLQKMRQEREDKERDRLEELHKRRQLQQQKANNDPKRKQEMEELSKMFDSEEEQEGSELEQRENEHEESQPEQEDSEPEQRENELPSTLEMANPTEAELGELLETTAEESLLEIKAEPREPEAQEDTSLMFVDDEGYTVTQKPSQKTSSTPVKRPTKAVSTPSEPESKKRKQQSLMNFFNKRK